MLRAQQIVSLYHWSLFFSWRWQTFSEENSKKFFFKSYYNDSGLLYYLESRILRRFLLQLGTRLNERKLLQNGTDWLRRQMKKFLHLDHWRLQLHHSNPYWNIWCSKLINLKAQIAAQGHLDAQSTTQGHLEAPSGTQGHKIQHIKKHDQWYDQQSATKHV